MKEDNCWCVPLYNIPVKGLYVLLAADKIFISVFILKLNPNLTFLGAYLNELSNTWQYMFEWQIIKKIFRTQVSVGFMPLQSR